MKVAEIAQNSPNSWADFVEFYNSNFEKHQIVIENLPFEFLLGLYLRYFNENGIEIDLSNTEFQELENEIVKAFAWQEVNRNHFS